MSANGPDEPPESQRPFLVVTGSSAGGIDALTAFVAALPPDLPASILVAQHLSPQHGSRLAEILSQRTLMRVETIERESVLKVGTIYVVPPNRDIEVIDSSAAVRLHVKNGPTPSIDRVLSTAAEIYRDRLIAIILSGLGSDGQRGARAVKQAGGTVIIQDPLSAGFPAMPLSIPPTLVDIIAAPEAIGTIISNYMRTAQPPAEMTEKKQLRTLLGQLRERSGIDFSQYKTATIMRRLSRVMVASGVESLTDYLSYLQRNPDEYQRLVNAFLIKVTEFFRDAALFDALRDKILPKLIADAREQSRELRIWSAGTSTGEEAYSLAIMCAELLQDEPAIDVRIFATDIDEKAIEFARRGVYSAEVLSHVPPHLVQRYFTRVDDRYEVSKKIRNMTVFGQHDLGQRAPFPRVDLCLCRNVLIYFTKELQTRALQLFAFALRDGGYLALGKAETTTPLPQFFRLVDTTLKIYQREGERVVLPPTPLRDTMQGRLPSFLRNASQRDIRIATAAGETTPPVQSRDAIATYIGGSFVGIVVVDRNYDIIAINSAARAMLQIHGVGVGSDLIHLLPATGTQFRAMIDGVLSGQAVEPTVVLAKDPITGIDRWLQVFCYTERVSATALGETVGIVIVDVSKYETRIQESERLAADREKALHEQVQRAEEVSTRLRAVLGANDELSSINAELRTYNEQLLINAEEAASANEEIETLNEEMQATNEELETLNEELQATVEELNTTNDELESRSSELEKTISSKQQQMEKASTRFELLARAFEAIVPAYVIVDTATGTLQYVSPSLGDESSFANAHERWWQAPTTLTLANGTRWRTERRSLDGEDGALAIVTFAEVS